jgi:hypothetical protein
LFEQGGFANGFHVVFAGRASLVDGWTLIDSVCICRYLVFTFAADRCTLFFIKVDCAYSLS